MNNIYLKLLTIQKKELTFKKNAKNPYYNSSYLTLDELIKTLKPILNELKIVIIHKNNKRNVITEVIDTESNEKIRSVFPIPDNITDPQKMGSAITYAKRYNLGELFNIVTDEDDDGNANVKNGNNVKAEAEEIPL